MAALQKLLWEIFRELPEIYLRVKEQYGLIVEPQSDFLDLCRAFSMGVAVDARGEAPMPLFVCQQGLLDLDRFKEAALQHYELEEDDLFWLSHDSVDEEMWDEFCFAIAVKGPRGYKFLTAIPDDGEAEAFLAEDFSVLPIVAS